MEVNEVIKWFEWADDVYYCLMPDAKPDNDFYKQGKRVMNLLKSLQAENKALKKENEEYKGMWDVLKIAYDTELYGLKSLTLKKVMEDLEEKYLGGGE